MSGDSATNARYWTCRVSATISTHREIVHEPIRVYTDEMPDCNASIYGYTANDAANAPMLSINVPLGYKALPAREEWLKEYEA